MSLENVELVRSIYEPWGRGDFRSVQLGQVRTKAANLFHVRGGMVTRLVIWADQERGLAELGLSCVD